MATAAQRSRREKREPVRDELDEGGHGKEDPDRSAQPGQESGGDGEPVAALADAQEGDQGGDEQERVGVAHHEDEGRRRQRQQPDGSSGAGLVPELEDDQPVEDGKGR